MYIDRLRHFLVLTLAMAMIPLVSTAAVTIQQTGSWSAATPMPTARQEMPTVSLNGKIHVIGGINSATEAIVTHEVFDPSTGLWSTAADLPVTLHHHTVVSDGIALYVLGGYRNGGFAESKSFYRYDPQSDNWENLGDIPLKVGAHASVIDGEYIYIFGGTFLNSAYDGVQRFHIPTAQWETLSTMPFSSEHLTAAALNGKIYVIGGRLRVGFQLTNTDMMWIYTPDSDSWEEGPPMPSSRSGLGAVSVENSIITFGGESFDEGPEIFSNVERYTPATDLWDTLTPMAVPVHGIGAALVDGLVYIMGGGTEAGWSTTTTASVFSPPPTPVGTEHRPELLSDDLKIFPNPARGNSISFQFKSPASRTFDIRVIDMIGRVVQSSTLVSTGTDTGNYSIPSTGLTKGRYILSVQTQQTTVSRVFVWSGE